MGIFSELFEGVPARFDTGLASDQALSQLAQLIRWGPGKLDLTGEVIADRVVFQTVFGSSCYSATRFEGRVEASPHGAVLSGRFVGLKGARIPNAIIIVVLGLMFIGMLFSTLAQMVLHYDDMPDLLLRLAALLLCLMFVTGFACLMAWTGGPRRKDVDRMSQAIRGALPVDAAETVDIQGTRSVVVIARPACLRQT